MTTERIHIILKSGLPMGDVVFRGVYGTKNDSGKFIPSADFNKISHLFDALGDGAPISDDDVVCLEVPQCELPLVKAQLMSKLSARWTKNYGQLIPAQGGVVAVALQAECDRAERGVQSFMRDAGLTTWLVPVIGEVFVEHIGADDIERARGNGQSAVEFLKERIAAGVFLGDPRIDTRLPPGGLGFLMSEGAVIHRELGGPLDEGDLPEWCGPDYWDGLIANVECVVRVPAKTADEALKAAEWGFKIDSLGLSKIDFRVNSTISVVPHIVSENPQDNDWASGRQR